MLAVVITAASVQDRDAAKPLLQNLARSCTRIRLAWADVSYSGKLTAWAAKLEIRLEIVRERDAHAVPVLLGQGRRLFDHLPAENIELSLERCPTTPDIAYLAQHVTHLRYRVRP